VTATHRALACAAGLGLLLSNGCVLPSFESGDAVDAGDAGSLGKADSGPELGPACGRSAELPESCDRCIRAHCCELAEACGDGTECGDDLLEPITPVADFSTAFDPLLGCMQRDCNVECDVDFGCLDDYRWPVQDADSDVPVRVIDFAAEPDLPLEGFSVKACQALDPACENGLVDEGTTDVDGVAQLTLPPGFSGFFDITGEGYADTTAQWSEPIHRISGFTHYMLTSQNVDTLAVITGVHAKNGMPFAPDSGHLIFRVQGCLPLRYLGTDERPHAEITGAHVAFAPNDYGSDIFYTDGTGFVSLTLDETTFDGTGGAFEVPARNITVTATDVASGREIASGSVRVRPGAIGFAYLAPRSAP